MTTGEPRCSLRIAPRGQAAAAAARARAAVSRPHRGLAHLARQTVCGLLIAVLPLQPQAAEPAAAASAAPRHVVVIVPDAINMQFMALYVAEGAGLFAAENITTERQVTASKRDLDALAPRAEGNEVALLPPPVCLELIAAHRPLRVVANLLANDPINLVVRRSVAAARGLDPGLPLGERLQRMKGLRLGIAPNPPTRLKALFATAGLDPEHYLDIVTLRGREQNAAFASGAVDALYAHTPWLEEALVGQDALLVVNQSAGEVPALTGRQIHVLAVHPDFAARDPDLITALVRAVGRAAELTRREPAAAIAALARLFPDIEPRRLETIVRIYAPALPATPLVSAEGLRTAWSLYPANRPQPSIEGIRLEDYVDPRFATPP